MTFRKDISTRANKANSIMRIIRRTYTYLDPQSFKLLFKSLVRPHLDYGAPIWNPRLKGNITELEKVQRRDTHQVLQLKGLSYEDRCQHSGIEDSAVTWLRPTNCCIIFMIPSFLNYWTQLRSQRQEATGSSYPRSRRRTTSRDMCSHTELWMTGIACPKMWCQPPVWTLSRIGLTLIGGTIHGSITERLS